jgi:(p)ppGpp synthase/HD superfamily hydrolase
MPSGSSSSTYESAIQIFVTNRISILADISVALADMRVDIVSINTQNLDGASIINMVISCKDISHFNSIVSRVRNIKDVIRVTRVLGAST